MRSETTKTSKNSEKTGKKAETRLQVEALLGEFTQVLALHQDIEDILANDDLSKSQKLKKVTKRNHKLGKLVAKILPG